MNSKIRPSPGPIVDLPAELVFEIASHLGPGDSDIIFLLSSTCRYVHELLQPQIAQAQISRIVGMVRDGKLRLWNERRQCFCEGKQMEEEEGRWRQSSKFSGFTHVNYAPRSNAAEMRAVSRLLHSSTCIEAGQLDLKYYPDESHHLVSSLRPVSTASSTDICRLGKLLASFSEVPNLKLQILGQPRIYGPTYHWDETVSPFTFIMPPPKGIITSVHARTALAPIRSKSRFWTIISRWKNPFSADLTNLRPSTNSHQCISVQPSSPKGSPSPPTQPESEGLPSPSLTVPPSVTVVARRPEYVISIPSSPALSCLKLGSLFLFTPSYYSLTLFVMNNSRITHLELTDIPLTLFTASQFIASLTLPLLTNFRNTTLPIGFPDLLAFFERHPLLTHIDLGTTDCIGVVKLPNDRIILPHLQALAASGNYLNPIMENHERFPNLAEIVLQCSTYAPPLGLPPRKEFYPLFNRLRKIQSTLFSVSMSYLLYSGLLPWLLEREEALDSPVILSVKELKFESGGVGLEPLYEPITSQIMSLPIATDLSDTTVTGENVKLVLQRYIEQAFPNAVVTPPVPM